MATQTQWSARQSLHSVLHQARAASDTLFNIVREEALYERPIPERHRIIFYIGHLEAFDWNLFREHLFHAKPFNAALDKLFAFGIDPVGGGLPKDTEQDWPPLSEVRKYVSEARAAIDEAIGSLETSSASATSNAETFLRVAAEHRWMHVETLTYMFHRLPFDRKIPQTQTDVATESVPNEQIQIPAGTATLGLRRYSGSFGWDNEFEETRLQVPAFHIDKFMVSNADFLRFLEDGGYRNSSLWSPADWEWKEQQNVAQPVFWSQKDGQWNYCGMFQEFPLPPGWPVYVSHAEASAYARWAGKSLPTEAQWHRAAYGTRANEERAYPWGLVPSSASSFGNFDFLRWDPVSVNSFARGASDFGAVGLLGNGWEWTSTVFAPLPGFQPFPFYPGYSADFFDGKHYVLKGGSARTAAGLQRRSFRNWFQPHYQYVYAGFRCVSNE
jgi:gamma-glutamyl hercynylcysteine S-oxide synthase